MNTKSGYDTPDPAVEWGAADTQATEAVPPEIFDQETAANELSPLLDQARDVGYLKGFYDGQADTLTALRSLLLEQGSSNDETAHVLLAVRQRTVNP